jgi:hypothetical protein
MKAYQTQMEQRCHPHSDIDYIFHPVSFPAREDSKTLYLPLADYHSITTAPLSTSSPALPSCRLFDIWGVEMTLNLLWERQHPDPQWIQCPVTPRVQPTRVSQNFPLLSCVSICLPASRVNRSNYKAS